MKKIIFLQSKGNSLGGVALVNKTLGEAFVKNGYSIEILSLRNAPGVSKIRYNNIIVNTINTIDLWEITRRREILSKLFKFDVISFFSLFAKYIQEKVKKNNDFSKLKTRLYDLQPDYIICTQYEMLQSIPRNMLKKTFIVNHSSFDHLYKENIQAYKLFRKINKKIAKFVWLTENTCKKAVDYGLSNSTYIYNPVRFSTNKIADVVSNRKLVTISRLSAKVKRVDLMVEAVDELFRSIDNNDWVFELYGDGELDLNTMKIIENNKNIVLKGVTEKPKEILMKSSIYLSTSLYEGFSLSILEANECGVPVIAYDFGESCTNQILDKKTGIIVDFGDKNKLISSLRDLINNPEKLNLLSKNSKEFVTRFNVNVIVEDWKELFSKID